MEENKTNQQVEQKYTYEELSSIAGNLFQENKELKKRINMMNEAIADLQTQNLFAYVGMLNKMLDNAIHFKPEFIEGVASDLMDIKSKLSPMFIDGGTEDEPDTDALNGEGPEADASPEQA